MRALISVHDKTGVVDLARGLVDLGWEIVSSGGTSKALQEAGVPVTPALEPSSTSFFTAPACLPESRHALKEAVLSFNSTALRFSASTVSSC